MAESPNPVLSQLRTEHERFESLFAEIERECDIAGGGGNVALERLESICEDLRAGALGSHHTLEDRIYAVLIARLPRFGDDIYDLREDHRQSWREFEFFVAAVRAVRAGAPGCSNQLLDAAHSYIANERGHIIAEEELFFPYALQYLRAEEWDALRPDA